MKINYLYEAGVFGSYKNKLNNADSVKRAAKELQNIAKTVLLNNLSTKIEDLISEYLIKNYEKYNNDSVGLVLVGKNGNKKESYSNFNEDLKPVFRLTLENNIIVVIMQCTPYNSKIIIQTYMSWFNWIKQLKEFLNSNIDRITEDGSSFNYDGFDVKIEIDPDILDIDGRVNVDFMSITRTYNIDVIQEFVNHFYNKNIRIKTNMLVFYSSMSSNEMYQQFIKRFPYLVRATGSISFDLNAMTEFDLEDLRITSVLAYPDSDVKIYYNLKLDNELSETSLQGIDRFIHNEYNTSLEKFKEIAFQNKRKADYYLRRPKDVRIISVKYKYNNPKDIEIVGMSREVL